MSETWGKYLSWRQQNANKTQSLVDGVKNWLAPPVPATGDRSLNYGAIAAIAVAVVLIFILIKRTIK